MNWFKRKRTRPPETFIVPSVVFITEQDGPPERDLKHKLSQLFKSKSHVHRAYLSRVHYRDPNGFNVALCIRMSLADDKSMRKKIGGIFASIFGSHEHLDVIFIREDQENELRKVCKPFYES